eukprot:TRINITY_DN837_c0_g2_i12.p1 TRINITY_DN837_c0_g2~~TRINITY_DN837_c0_g2_i12.p1  ORF type:complete len:190 (-),score=32.70 TRINITY_DN837_c0_g2_i12:453-1022(-)
MQKWIKDLSKWAEYFREDWNQVNPVDESELRKKIKLLEEHSSQKVLQIEKLGSKLSLEEDAYQNTLNKLHEENERLETSFNERVQQKEKQKQEYEKEIERLRQLTSYLVESIHEIEFLGFKRDYFIQQNQKLSTAVEPLVGLSVFFYFKPTKLSWPPFGSTSLLDTRCIPSTNSNLTSKQFQAKNLKKF